MIMEEIRLSFQKMHLLEKAVSAVHFIYCIYLTVIYILKSHSENDQIQTFKTKYAQTKVIIEKSREIFMEQELRFGLDFGRMANFPAFIASKSFDL